MSKLQDIVDKRIKHNQDVVSKQFEQLMQTFERSQGRKVEPVVPMSEDAFQKTMAFLDKLEELIDLELIK